MSDVFISYARESRDQAERIAAALQAQGYAVWRDDALPAHRDYSEVIEERLRAAKAVVVVWCADAVRSQWVRAEADVAREAGKLVQLTLDGARLPMPFNRIQCAELIGWTGDPSAPGWRKVAESVAALAGGASRAEPAVPARPLAAEMPSVAVIPFVNLSGDPEQQYFTEGMVEEIVAGLSRYKSLRVVATGGSILSAGSPVSPGEAARAVGARYLLEGSVRKAGSRVRITLHLIDAASGGELWADRLEDALDDVFALQDRVAERVAGVVEIAVQDADVRKAAERPTQDLSSYDLFLRATFLFRISRKPEIEQAIDCLDQAVARDPNFAIAMSHACVCLRQMLDHGWTADPDGVRRKGLDYAERAMRIAPNDPRVLAQVAMGVPGLEGRMDRALSLVDRATALNPNSGFLWLASGSIRLRNGDPETAAAHLERALQLDPISSISSYMRMYLAAARFQQRRLDEALALYETTTYRLPVSYVILASLYGHLGRFGEARQALAQLNDLAAGSVDKLVEIWFPRAEYRQLLMDGLSAASLATASGASVSSAAPAAT